MKWRRPGDEHWRRPRRARGLRLPPPPRGLPRHLRPWWLVAGAVISAAAAVVVPMCPRHDAAGRPLWRVETVHDGDTVTCIDTAGRPRKIRLLGIDAPEFGQPFGAEARRALAAKLAGSGVRVAGDAHDQHGRLLGTLWIDDRNLNLELVAEGWAWVFGGFAPDDDMLAAEAAARRDRRGLWADPQPLPPSQWRQSHPPAPSARPFAP